MKWLVAQAVFDVDERERALDCNSQKIRRKAGNPEALLNPWGQNFLVHLFNKVILSTAFVECLFAHFKQWCIRSPKPLSAALLQAAHVTSVMQRANADKRQRADDSSGRPLKRQRVMLQQGITGHELETTLSAPPDASRKVKQHSKRTRPGWIVREGEASKTNCRHVWICQFIGDKAEVGRQRDAFREAVKQWPTFKRLESNEDHARLKVAGRRNVRHRKFMAISRMKKITEAVTDAPPIWNVSDGCAEYSLSADAVNTQTNKKSGVADVAKEHMTTSQVLGPDESLPGTVSYAVPIDSDVLKLSPADQDEVEVIIKQLLAIFHIRGKRKESNSKAMLVKRTAAGQCCISRCLNMLMKSPCHAGIAIFST